MKKVIILMLSLCLILTSFFLLQKLLIPKYISDVPEGSLIEEYYNEKVFDHDVVFIGDCEVYENISPVQLWKDYGISSYIRGSAQQLIWQSYYLMEDTLRYEKPDVFVFNVLSMKYGEPQNEAYNRLNLDGMKWSKSKWNAIEASMTDEESMIDYLFPLLRYHQRWSELTSEDFQYMFSKKPLVSHNGFIMRADELPVKTIPKDQPLSDYQFSKTCYEYLDRMVKLCKENGIKLVLMKVPSLYPSWYDEWDEQMVDYAKKNDLLYVNFLDSIEEIGLDFNHDTYDRGLHLNLSGAEKLSHYFGKILQDNFNLKNRQNDESIRQIWQEKVSDYNKMKDDQYAQIKKYGYLKGYGAKTQGGKEE
ncbi:SGNH/GDSL hydrolase family protein [Longibaculum muris]|uniref:hypothetical protein n=1 Tax=Longibaculum muris TaxID=1796628 RepID=UPI0022E29E72|nr:hypothetical protein [Longibaculum muris]